MILAALLAAVAVLPADRLALADRLFNRGKYAEARSEYAALDGAEGVPADGLLFRLAECDRALGRNDEARKRYSELVLKHPESSKAGRARFLYAMGASGETRRQLLQALDTDRTDLDTRVAALYHLGLELNSVECFERCVKLDPKGRYADYASLRCGTLLAASPVESERRRGVEVLLGIAFGKSSLSDEALYLAAVQSYRDKRYGEAGSLFRRYRKNHPKGAHGEDCAVMSVWCDFMEGRYADASVACGEAKTDDLAYIKAASAYALGNVDEARRLFRRYLDEFPQGKYRADAELPLARIEFEAARKAGDASRTIESARRGFGLSRLAADELRLAWAYEKAGKNDLAREEYARVARDFSGTEEAAEALYRRALLDARAESWSSAELTLAEALATGKCLKFKASALYWRGIAAMRLGHDAEACGFLQDALALGLALDESREARLMVADADFRAGRLDAAREAYAKLVAEGAAARMTAARLHAVGRLIGGDGGRTCADALTKSDAAEWRQAGWALLGELEERRGAYTAAIAAYRRAMAEKALTEQLPEASLRLGLLELRAEEFDRAEETLKRAIALNADNASLRAEAYLALAQGAAARGDVDTARAYATVVTSLFDGSPCVREAQRILGDRPEDAK